MDKLAIINNLMKEALISEVDNAKKPGEWNVLIRKSKRTRWDYFVENPQGGGFGMTSYTSAKAALNAAISGKSFGGKDKVWVIESIFDYDIGDTGDYKVTKKYWLNVGQ